MNLMTNLKGNSLAETIANLYPYYGIASNTENDPGYGLLLNHAFWLHKNEGWGFYSRPDNADSATEIPGVGTLIRGYADFDKAYRTSDPNLWDVFVGHDHRPSWNYVNPVGLDKPNPERWVPPINPELIDAEVPGNEDGDNQPPATDYSKDIQELKNQIAQLQGKNAALEHDSMVTIERVNQLIMQVVKYGDPIALQTWNNKVVCAEDGGGKDVNATRNGVGPWETFFITAGQSK